MPCRRYQLLTLFALLRGVRRPAKRVRLQFVQTIELGKLGRVAMVFWNPTAPERRVVRNELAAHIRYLADFKIAPWNRWPDLRRRREALFLYGRRLGHHRPGVEELIASLRQRYPDTYHEPFSKTRRRLYLLSAQIRRAHLPRGQH
jgi:hypothetical protein